MDFLKIGAIGFGGGMAVIALMEKELIKKKGFIPLDEFLHAVAFGQILGPFAFNASIFIGYRLYGIMGGIVCAAAFMFPSILLVIILSFLYFSFHTIPSLNVALQGLGPVVIALIVSAAWSMGKKALKSKFSILITLLSFILAYIKVNSALILIVAGGMGLIYGVISERNVAKDTSAKIQKNGSIFLMPLTLFSGTNVVSFPHLFLTFFKIGLVFFGGGFVLVPILHQQMVETLGWLSQKEFIDGVAISNLTPGPIAVLATFVGYKVYGVTGALASTIALFLPAIILMLIISKSYGYLKDWYYFKFFLNGISPSVIGLVVNAALVLSLNIFQSYSAYALFLVSLLFLIRFSWHPAFVLALGAFSGIIGFIK